MGSWIRLWNRCTLKVLLYQTDIRPISDKRGNMVLKNHATQMHVSLTSWNLKKHIFLIDGQRNLRRIHGAHSMSLRVQRTMTIQYQQTSQRMDPSNCASEFHKNVAWVLMYVTRFRLKVCTPSGSHRLESGNQWEQEAIVYFLVTRCICSSIQQTCTLYLNLRAV